MAVKPAKEASGMRHLWWGHEVLASMKAHLKLNISLSDAQIQALMAERSVVDKLVMALQAAVVPYRGYLDSAYRDNRAEQRVGGFLCDEAMHGAVGGLRHLKDDIAAFLPGGYASILSNLPLSRILAAGRVRTVELARNAAMLIATLPPVIPRTQSISKALTDAADILAAANQHRTQVIDPQRKPLRLAVERAVMNLREGLEQMDGRLRTHFSVRFIDSLYPELTKSRKPVYDAADDDADDMEAGAAE